MEMGGKQGLTPGFNGDVSRVGKLFNSVEAINSLEAEYGEYMPMVIELITFFGKKYKNNFFNMFTTSVDEFSRDTGIDKSTLNRKVKLPSDRKTYPIHRGREFSTLFDYTIYLMATRGWVLTQEIEAKKLDEEKMTIDTIKIIEGVAVTTKKNAPNGAKIYDFRFSPVFLGAMQYNFWPVDTKVKRVLGQFKRSKNIRMLYHHISSHMHSAISQNLDFIILSMDEMAGFARLNKEQAPKHIKYSIKRMLDKICSIENSGICYEFISKGKYNEDYHVKLTFKKSTTLENKEENNFHTSLVKELVFLFKKIYGPNGERAAESTKLREKDLFQAWISKPDVDSQHKLRAIQKAYSVAYKKVISAEHCHNILINGIGNSIEMLKLL